VTPERALVALDAKVTLDDNALYRHPENAELRDLSAEDPQERMAKERHLTYVSSTATSAFSATGRTRDVDTRRGRATRRRAGELPRRRWRRKAEAITAAVEVILSNPR